MIITFLVIVVGVGSLASVLMIAANARTAAEANAASNDVYRRRGFSGCLPSTISISSSVAIVGLWTWYAIAVHDWRFAAMAWTGFVASLICRAILKGASQPKPVETGR